MVRGNVNGGELRDDGTRQVKIAMKVTKLKPV